MRPVRLTLSAFGPFRTTVEVDFSKVEDSLFLIHGATGAGKSTILDGICYALYGVSAGGERKPKDLRCQAASGRTKTVVGFEFDVDGQRYRIRRSPEQEKAGRGGKVTTERSHVELAVRDGDGPSDESQPLLALGLESWRTLSEKAGGVATHVEALLGLDADQFRQVVVLPQGQFREFLLAPSRERQEILETLFHTERYRSIEEEIRRRSEGLKDALSRQRDRRAFIFEQARVEGAQDLAARRRDVDQRLALLAQVLEGQTTELATRRDKVAEAERWAERRRAWDLVRQERKVLAQQTEAMAAKGGRAEVLAKAKQLRPELMLVREAERELNSVRDRVRAVQKDCEEAAAQLAKRQAALGTDEQHQQRRAALVKQRMALAVHEETLAKARSLRVTWDKAKETRAAAEQALTTAQAEAQAADQARAVAERRVVDAKLDAARFEARRGQMLRLLQTQKALVRHAELDAQRKEDVVALDALRRSIAESTAQLENKKAARAHAERAFLSTQAAALAHTLEDGAPCPVCGSPDHPAPAAPDAHGGSERTWRSRGREVEKLEKTLAEQSHSAQALTWRLDKADEELAALRDQTADTGLDEVSAELAKAEAALARAEHAHESLEGLATTLADAQTAYAQKAEAEKVASVAAEAARQSEGRLSAQHEQLVQGLPADVDDLAAQMRALEDDIAKLDDGRRAEQEAVLAAERSLAESKGQLAQMSDEQTARGETLANRRSSLHRAAVEAGFADIESLARDAADADQAESMAAEVTAYNERVARLAAEHARHEEAFAAAPDVSLADEKERLAALEKEHVEGARRLGELKAEAGQLSLWLQGLEETEAGEQQLQQKHQAWAELTDVALGNNPTGMTFQRFVLATLLDEVLENASRRLLSMTRDRYEILRARSDEPSRRRARGLELRVYDRQNGTERGVHTLSGGESFLAALALALGLADAVSARAGGRTMEAIFVDEGFGGLDPESLDLALDALSQLHAAGRMVGIISHVGELKERISTRIEVVRTPRGSRLSGQFVRAA